MASLGRLRWANLHEGDLVHPGDVVFCGAGDQVVLAFPRSLLEPYLGIDAAYLLPALFEERSDREAFLTVPPGQLMRLTLPAGIGTEAPHPAGRVRRVQGSPRRTSDLRLIAASFGESEIFALPLSPPALHSSSKASAAPSEKPESATKKPRPVRYRRRLGVTAFPRMGPRSGVVLERVAPDGPAGRAGLGTGDTIIGVDGEAVVELRALREVLARGEGPLEVLKVRKKGSDTLEVLEVRFDEGPAP